MTKRKSSHRTLPLSPSVEQLLISHRREAGYVCLNTHNELLKPSRLTSKFKALLRENRLREIRYHDLRHTCAALLIAARMPLIDVSQWLGHSSIAITADLYGHLEFISKEQCASILHPISISIVDAEMDGCNAESIAQFGDGCCSGAIFLYRTWNDFDGKFTPATVLLHELGHQLHFHLTNELCRLPESFYDFLRQLGADYSRLSNADMLEVFADTFLLAVIHKTKEFGNPFPEIDENTHERCYSYIRHILSTI